MSLAGTADVVDTDDSTVVDDDDWDDDVVGSNVSIVVGGDNWDDVHVDVADGNIVDAVVVDDDDSSVKDDDGVDVISILK